MPSVLLIKEWAVRAARLMVGIPDYQTCVEHRRTCRPNERIMSYQEFFRNRQDARYSTGNGRFRGCCSRCSFVPRGGCDRPAQRHTITAAQSASIRRSLQAACIATITIGRRPNMTSRSEARNVCCAPVYRSARLHGERLGSRGTTGGRCLRGTMRRD